MRGLNDLLIFQAYTHELENKVSQLEEENERLRKQRVCFALSYIATKLFFTLASDFFLV